MTSGTLSGTGAKTVFRPGRLFALIPLFYCTIGGKLPIGNGDTDYISTPSLADSTTSSIVGALIVVFAIIAILLPSLRRLPERVRVNFPILAAPCFAVASTLWSQYPAVTIRKSVILVLLVLFAVEISYRFEGRKLFELFQTLAFVATALAYAWVAIYPTYGIRGAGGGHGANWSGIFIQKNLGAEALCFLLPAMFLRTEFETYRHRMVRRGTLLAMLGFIIMTRSVTGNTVAFVLCLLIAILRVLGRMQLKHRQIAVALLAVGAATVVLIAVPLFISKALSLFGRDMTFSDRTEIWAALLRSVFRRPLTGYGYAAFWVGSKGAAMDAILSLKGAIGYAHNGFLDVWLQLGAIGSALVVWPITLGLVRSFKAMIHESSDYAEWYFLMFVLTVVYNMDEGTLLLPYNVGWMLLIIAYCGIHRGKKQTYIAGDLSTVSA